MTGIYDVVASNILDYEPGLMEEVNTDYDN